MGSTWSVVSQVPDQIFVGGRILEGVDITIELADKSQIVVEVSNSDLQSVATVKALIQAAVDTHDAVASLSGP